MRSRILKMRSRIPKTYTILIARTGREPITISFRPLPAVISLLVLLGTPLTWVGFTVRDVFLKNAELAKQNDELTETAYEVLSELSSLDAEIENLRERAGLPDVPSGPASVDAGVPQGGAAREIEPEELFKLAQWRMPLLTSALDSSVKPALEETLAEEAAREAAFPNRIPLKGTLEVSSEFGLRPNPFGWSSYEMHEGIDFKGPYGEPVFSTAEGVVEKAEYHGGYGNHVIIDHGYGYKTLYAHLSEIDAKAGDRISQGTLIGFVGSTGRSSGPHLHYGIFRQGVPVNPAPYLGLRDSQKFTSRRDGRARRRL
ncbi:MAG: M23 family metallopeptidase [Leptolyngbyaceae cyanobacterium MO_188.B28]|nr:M23 family metallopeptidase [Leptolyngbyaceae cyanobacterium MO_188.B28]